MIVFNELKTGNHFQIYKLILLEVVRQVYQSTVCRHSHFDIIDGNAFILICVHLLDTYIEFPL